MKRFIEILLTLLIVMTLIGCQKVTDPTIDTTEPPSTVTSSNLSSNLPDEHTEEYEAVCVDIANNGGYYALMSKVVIDYYQGEVVSIYVEEPAVLAFKVPDKYTNGVGTIDGNKVLEMTDKINSYLDTNEADNETQELLYYLLQQLDNIVLLTSAST